VNGESTYFRLVNRNKYGVTLDLKAEQDRATFQRLIATADVLIENFRPGALQRLGLSAETLLAWNPEIIVVSISGFGQTGPMSERPAYDMTVQALTGVMDVTGQRDGPPTRCGVSIGDIVPALYATVATLAALRRRDSGHGGAHVDIAMFDSLISLLESVGMRALHSDQVVTRFGNEHALSAPFGTFHAADGLIAVAVANDAIFRRLALALGQDEWPEDPRFCTEAARSAHRGELNASLEARFGGMSRAEILELLNRADVPSAPVQTVREALTSTQAAARGLIAVEEDGFRTIRNPIRISGFQPEASRPAPGLGADNSRVSELFAGDRDV
jgi:CoA:oxalate CoA-transferase